MVSKHAAFVMASRKARHQGSSATHLKLLADRLLGKPGRLEQFVTVGVDVQVPRDVGDHVDRDAGLCVARNSKLAHQLSHNTQREERRGERTEKRRGERKDGIGERLVRKDGVGERTE